MNKWILNVFTRYNCQRTIVQNIIIVQFTDAQNNSILTAFQSDAQGEIGFI